MQVLDKDKLYREGMIDQIKREIAIMKDLHHPHIVDLKEVMASKDKIYMVMEFMPGGELFDKIVSEGPLEVHLSPPSSMLHLKFPCTKCHNTRRETWP
jgi:5'-AMP-activated protein kinase catalytic alpha subunit